GTAPCGSSYGTFQSLPSGWVVACLVTHSGFWIVELSQKITGELIRVSFSKNHKLVDIAATAGLSITDEEESIFNILAEYIIWDGRYPTPKQPNHLRDHWQNQNKVLTDEVQLGSLKGGISNGKLDFENLQPIWRRFSDAYLAAYS